MNITSRSYLTAGVAALSVGAIALTPVQPMPDRVALAPQRVVNDLSVELAAAINPIQPWVDTIKASFANIGVLFEDWSVGLYVGGTIPAPESTVVNGQLGHRTGGYESGTNFALLRQFVANQVSYLRQLPDIGGIFNQIVGNYGNAFRAPFTPGVELPGRFAGLLPGQYNQNVSGVPVTSVLQLPVNPRTVGALLPVLAPTVIAALKPILDFATTPISGVLLGAIGPVLGPALSVVSSVNEIVTALRDQDISGAINGFLNIPANAVNAALNGGQVLDLSKILGDVLPADIKTIGIKMGGLLSPGGVAFDALAAKAEAVIAEVPVSVDVPGLPVGPIGSMIGLSNYVAKAIKPPVSEPAPGASATRQVKAAAATQVETSAAVADVAEEAPAPKRQSRATARADKSGGADKASRPGRAARNAG